VVKIGRPELIIPPSPFTFSLTPSFQSIFWFPSRIAKSSRLQNGVFSGFGTHWTVLDSWALGLWFDQIADCRWYLDAVW